MQDLKERYNKDVIAEMTKKFGYKNVLAVPRILKVVIGAGTGSIADAEKKKGVATSLMLITGQKTKDNVAKQSIASFKLREGTSIGHSVTLRGNRMYDFMSKLINIALPRVRDFRGIDTSLIDNIGNMTIGVREHLVFPETSKEDVRKVFGLGVTIVTSAKSKEEAFELFKLLGFPFKKEDNKK